MKVITGLPDTNWPRVEAAARAAEAAGFDGVNSHETAHDPFLPVAVAARATERVELGTGIAVAFPRSPMVVAQTAWDLHVESGGRFHLGLGSQVKGHNERRFSVAWLPPAPRLRDYVEALGEFFKDADKLDHKARVSALLGAMERVMQRYPEDTEAAILYSLILSANFDPADKKYTNQLKAARILEAIFEKQPEHPGVAHYLIHSYDYPPIARHGLEAARRYSKIAPDAPHALHMPSHIFTRVGA